MPKEKPEKGTGSQKPGVISGLQMAQVEKTQTTSVFQAVLGFMGYERDMNDQALLADALKGFQSAKTAKKRASDAVENDETRLSKMHKILSDGKKSREIFGKEVTKHEGSLREANERLAACKREHTGKKSIKLKDGIDTAQAQLDEMKKKEAQKQADVEAAKKVLNDATSRLEKTCAAAGEAERIVGTANEKVLASRDFLGTVEGDFNTKARTFYNLMAKKAATEYSAETQKLRQQLEETNAKHKQLLVELFKQAARDGVSDISGYSLDEIEALKLPHKIV